jgi:hypothetical protein
MKFMSLEDQNLLQKSREVTITSKHDVKMKHLLFQITGVKYCDDEVG